MDSKNNSSGGMDERVSELFVPDTLLPSQYFDRIARRYDDGPRRLMLAVLEDGVDVYRKQLVASDPRGKELFREAEAWINDSDRTWIYSFENICDVLAIESAYLRRGLRALKARARSGDGTTVTLRAENELELYRASGA